MQRLVFVQWLRVFLIALVVAHHAAQPYGPTGGSWPVRDPAESPLLLPFFALNAAFFMGFFFLIAGYFTPGSFDRKGAGAFLRDRLVRLGIPLLVVTVLVFGPVAWLVMRPPQGFMEFFLSTYLGRWQVEMGPLWFIALLLVFDLLYALWRTVAAGLAARPLPPPGDRAILAYALALGVAGAAVRTVSPQDRWIDILYLIPVEPAHLPQYASLFVIGIVAGRNGWFTTLPAATGGRWFAVGMAAFVIAFAIFGSGIGLPFGIDLGVAWGFLEAFVAVGMILGLTVFFRRHADRQGRWLDSLDGSVYGVYLIHFFVVVGLQFAIVALPLPALVKFALVTVAALAISFPLVAMLRRIPAIRRVI